VHPLNHSALRFNHLSSADLTSPALLRQNRMDTRILASQALSEGIVIEPGDVFFQREATRAQMRLGYSSIPSDRIGVGIALLSRLVETWRP
jgi:DNA-binding transcriptional MocR family regulator